MAKNPLIMQSDTENLFFFYTVFAYAPYEILPTSYQHF